MTSGELEPSDSERSKTGPVASPGHAGRSTSLAGHAEPLGKACESVASERARGGGGGGGGRGAPQLQHAGVAQHDGIETAPGAPPAAARGRLGRPGRLARGGDAGVFLCALARARVHARVEFLSARLRTPNASPMLLRTLRGLRVRSLACVRGARAYPGGARVAAGCACAGKRPRAPRSTPLRCPPRPHGASRTSTRAVRQGTECPL